MKGRQNFQRVFYFSIFPNSGYLKVWRLQNEKHPHGCFVLFISLRCFSGISPFCFRKTLRRFSLRSNTNRLSGIFCFPDFLLLCLSHRIFLLSFAGYRSLNSGWRLQNEKHPEGCFVLSFQDGKTNNEKRNFTILFVTIILQHLDYSIYFTIHPFTLK